MTQRLKFAFLILLAAATAWMTPAAKADQRDKLTVMTFNEPVEIPGQVLPPGTYIFKLFDTQGTRNVVHVFTQDQKQLLATIIAVTDYRLEPTGNTALTLEERPSGMPEALRSWFYPGDTYGVEFVYPKSEQHFADRSEPAATAVETATAVPAPEPEPAPVPTMAVVTETTSFEAPVVPQEEFFLVPAAPADSGPAVPATPETLPETAGNFAAIPLFGMLLLSGGFTALRFAAKQK